MKVRTVGVGRVWDCILCTSVSEEGGDGEGVRRDQKDHLCCHTQEVVYYVSRNRELNIRLMNEGRCDERLKGRVEESTYLTYTGLHDKTN
jgi:hypothetical protein